MIHYSVFKISQFVKVNIFLFGPSKEAKKIEVELN